MGMGKLYVGTSGYNYLGWKGLFYPENLPQREWLAFYSNHYNTIEINATFYRSFARSVFANWSKQTSESFVFTIKGSRFITHIKRIKDVKEEVERFFEMAVGLGEKLSCVLWQFPGSFRLDPNQRENIDRLKVFLDKLPRNSRQAFEFRHKSWFIPEVFELLDKNKAGFVMNDSPHFPSIERVTGDFVYIRFHGPSSLYSSSYSTKQLTAWVAKIKKYLKKYDVCCYFNNDINGYAVKNARTLQELVKKNRI